MKKINCQIFLFPLLLLCLLNTLHAQSFSEFKNDVKEFYYLGPKLGHKIIQPEKEDIQIFLISSAAIAASFLLDNSIRELRHKNQTDFNERLFKIDRYYGHKHYTPALFLILYSGGFVTGNKKIKEMGLHSLQALLYTGLITVSIKELAGRSRPYLEEGLFHFEPFSFEESRRSFFSGHTSATFAVSTVMAHEIDHPLWRCGWYGAAILVGAARIYHDRHWFSDVATGAIVGYSIGKFVSSLYKNRKSTDNLSMSINLQKQYFLINYSFYLEELN
jgi:membrane-associated phospholipid phosphatase